MRVARCLSCCWPGLARLWWQGEGTGVLVAVAFAGLLNSLIVFHYVWPETLPTWFIRCGWCGLSGIWLYSAWRSYRLWPALVGGSRHNSAADLFPQAQAQYLKGRWFEAESLLANLLRDNPRDVDARLLLATVYRRTKRVDDARRQLQTLSKLEGGGKWALEIEQERRLLDRLVKDLKNHHHQPQGNDTSSAAA